MLWLGTTLLLAGTAIGKIRDVVLFGDSFTDQSRQHSIANGTYPGKNYQEIYPPADTAADGGIQWPWYLGVNGNFKIWNYAVGGAVCSERLTPLYGMPDVSEGQMAWFIEDHVVQQRLTLDAEQLVVVIYVGTNDIGIKSFITGDQAANVTLGDVAECQLNTIWRMRKLGARKFVLNSMIPLHLTRLYANSSAGTIYWPETHDGALWHRNAYEYVRSVNGMLRDGVARLNREFAGDGKVVLFDTYGLFGEMYGHPWRYLNGTIAPNATGHCHQCPDANDWRQCGVGDCSAEERDSYLWWDELHPSEQAGRVLAVAIERLLLSW
ncbi:hypothetical protein HGRIS_007264 [Hohenbuehelia grisea]|uniref:Carbohydrate esterase family 16 protein n=1 Tax=Hohenbuehelia grisea TaxID=104357 RepID=A0ABR3JBP1_9AGAR